jgi:glycosyltransferase involved in cell wall biosynthesis
MGSPSAGWGEKGPDVLLEALPHLSDLPLVASVVGDGAMRAALETRARGLGLNGRIRWHGALANGAGVLRAFDVCVLCSRTEGTPMVLFEAIAAGVPVVVTAVGGMPDVVSPTQAVLVSPDDPAALAAAIRSVYEDPAMARERACRAHARVERDFAVAPWLERYEAIYRLVAA